MKKIILLACAFLLGAVAAKAQDTAGEYTFPGPYKITNHAEISRGEFYLNGRELSDWEIRQVIGDEIFNETYAPALRQRRAGLILVPIGAVLTGVGGLVTIIGAATMGSTVNYSSTSTPGTWEQDASGRIRYYGRSVASASTLLAGVGLFTAGSLTLGAGIPLLVIGQRRLNWVEDAANEKLSQKGASLNLSSSPNGFGLCLAF